MRVLVEDSRSLAEVLVEGLRDQGMAVDAATDGLEAAAKLDVNSYDVVVLDRDLPGIHGDPLCQRHRRGTGAGGPGQDRASRVRTALLGQSRPCPRVSGPSLRRWARSALPAAAVGCAGWFAMRFYDETSREVRQRCGSTGQR
jgi:CheY-like chemotaxis protein